MSKYVDDQQHLFDLYSVIIHSGDALTGVCKIASFLVTFFKALLCVNKIVPFWEMV